MDPMLQIVPLALISCVLNAFVIEMAAKTFVAKSCVMADMSASRIVVW
jgi:hypothetical protein